MHHITKPDRFLSGFDFINNRAKDIFISIFKVSIRKQTNIEKI